MIFNTISTKVNVQKVKTILFNLEGVIIDDNGIEHKRYNAKDRQIIDMKEFGCSVSMYIQHSTQKLSVLNGTVKDRKYTPYMVKPTNAVGVNGFFFKVHENPEETLNDGLNIVYLHKFKSILGDLN